jgi:hypothetical protein
MKSALPVVLGLAVILTACGGARTTTERNMLEWGPLLNMYMATNMEAGNSYPESLDEIDPTLRADLSETDGWGNKLLYRKLRIDLYNIISAGPDGEFGNDDDIIVQNGALYEPAKIYGEHPLVD